MSGVIALISDIHANLPALEAVLEDMARMGAGECRHAGDLVGYNPFPNEAITKIREAGIPGVAGNYDLAAGVSGERPWAEYLKPTISATGLAAYEWTRGALSSQSRDYLLSLPRTLSLDWAGQTIFIAHGSPLSIREYLYPDTPLSHLEEVFAGIEAKVLVVGHTHLPFTQQLGERLLINPGSVGKPKDGDPRASYALFYPESPPRVVLRRVSYDLSRTIKAIRSSALPRQMAESLQSGRSTSHFR
jgi:putative phosphoesterase